MILTEYVLIFRKGKSLIALGLNEVKKGDEFQLCESGELGNMRIAEGDAIQNGKGFWSVKFEDLGVPF